MRYETAWTKKLFFLRDKGRTFRAIAKLIIRRLEQVVAIEQAVGRVSETLGKAAQGSASLGRIRLPNIQAPSNATYRRHGAKIRVKPHDRNTRLYCQRARLDRKESVKIYRLAAALWDRRSANLSADRAKLQIGAMKKFIGKISSF